MYRFSINTQSDLRVNSHYGYGKSLVEIKDSLRRSKINNERVVVEHNSDRSKYQMYYGPHPVHNSHYGHQFKIHMSQTESDRFESHKVIAYSNADEFWTASDWGRKAAINSGISEEKVFVYHHGIYSDLYPSKIRGKNDKVRFLHIDSGSPRKRSDIVEEAFNIFYQKNKDIELTLKYSHSPHKGKSWEREDTLLLGGDWIRPGTRHINETLSQHEMLALMHYHDVLVYPSEGEGFGLIPLEALATGMPVISTYQWAPYKKFFPEGHLESEIKQSTIDWGYNKVGNGTITSVESVLNSMIFFRDNIKNISDGFYSRSEAVKSEYDWMNITPNFFTKFFNRVQD